MISKRFFSFVLVGFSAFILSSSVALGFGGDEELWYTYADDPAEVILNPQDRTNCTKNFTIENLGNDRAEVAVIMGLDKVFNSQIQPREKKSYFSIMDNAPWQRIDGKATNLESAVIMSSDSDNPRLKVSCK